MKPGLYLVSTPIGNLDDITLRAINILKNSDLILCENTRHSMKLLNNFNIKPSGIDKYTDHDFDKKSLLIKNKIQEGGTISLISDAGSPLVSDPGSKLVKYLFSINCHVESIPGPSSLISAIQLSGFLNPYPYIFTGFLPKKIAQKRKVLEEIKNSNVVFYTTASQLNKEIDLLFRLNQETRIVILNEMTKIHEKRIYLTMETYKEILPINLKGELVVCAEIRKIKYIVNFSDNDLIKDIEKFGKKNIYEIYRTKYGIKRNDLYDKILSIKK